jgi:hypothetical protein
MRKSRIRLNIDPVTREALRKLLRAQTTPLGLARRVQAMLNLADGLPLVEAGRQCGLHRTNVYRWRRRFICDGIEGLKDRPRCGRRPTWAVMESRRARALAVQANAAAM